jgi:hypothetical protein
MLTGCPQQYEFTRKDGAGWRPYGLKNANTGEWEPTTNGKPYYVSRWRMDWPPVGGGGDRNLEVDNEEMFERMCAWDDQNYIMCAGTRSGSVCVDTEDHDGIQDGHAYSVIDCFNDVAGTEFDLIQVRNPWGHGEMGT